MHTTSVPDPPRFRMPRPVRLWLPVALSLIIQVPGTLWALTRHDLLHWPEAGAALSIALVGPLALIGARRYPGPVAAIAVAAAVADVVLRPWPQPPPAAMIFGVVLGLIHGARLWVYPALVAGWSCVLLFGPAVGLDWHPGRIVGTTLAVAALVVVGEMIGRRRQRAAERWRRVREQRERAAREERVRIARDLHDVLAHSLSQISVQAGVGLHLMDAQPEQARSALQSIKATSKTALDEVRGVLGALRGDEVPLRPAQGIAQIAELAETSTALDVVIDELTADTAPDAVQQAAYRIVQESLTNVIRHAHATTARIAVRERRGELVVSVTDDGRGGARESGNGILGMRERAELLGGSLAVTTGAQGTTVTARLPLSKEAT